MNPKRYDLSARDTVNVGQPFMSSCSINRCKCRKVHYVFAYDGAPKSSRLIGSFCQKHLQEGVLRAWAENTKANLEGDKR